MASEEPTVQKENDFEKQLERAKRFKEDLDNGEGWTQRYCVLNEYNSWSKTFPEEDVPVKTLYKFYNLPISAEKFAEMIHPSNMMVRKKWDKAFAGLKLLIPVIFRAHVMSNTANSPSGGFEQALVCTL